MFTSSLNVLELTSQRMLHFNDIFSAKSVIKFMTPLNLNRGKMICYSISIVDPLAKVFFRSLWGFSPCSDTSDSGTNQNTNKTSGIDQLIQVL